MPKIGTGRGMWSGCHGRLVRSASRREANRDLRNRVVDPACGNGLLWLGELPRDRGSSHEQKEKLAEISKEVQAKISELRAAMRDEAQRSDAFQKLRELREAADTQAMGVLTAEQKESYEARKGGKFELPPRRGLR